jgi:hypothetical protein
MQSRPHLNATLLAEALMLMASIDSDSIARAATPPPVTRTSYQFTTIDLSSLVGPAQPGNNYPSGITDAGLVSGYYTDTAGHDHGFLWQNGTLSALDAPDSVDTLLGTANDQGVVIGNYDDTAIVSRAALYNVGTQSWTPLPDISGKPINAGNAINDQGVALGMAYEGDLNSLQNGVGWIWNGSAYSFFTIQGQSTGSLGIFPLGINDSGLVTGYYADAQGTNHGFIKDGSTIAPFDVPGADQTYAGTLNNSGEVVGSYNVGKVSHGFLMRGTEFVTIDFPGADNTVLIGNNNRGQLTGYYWQTSANAQLFVATPQQLSVSRTGPKLLLSWPVTAVTFQLESIPDLSGNGSWSPVTPAGTTNGTTVSVTVPISPPQAFFRLRAAAP